MKFSHELKEALKKDGYPDAWVAAAVPYGQLKKCLKKAQRELEGIGLDEATITQLVQSQDQDRDQPDIVRRGSALALEYEVNGEKKLVPKLTLCVRFEDGVVTDVALSKNTRDYLQTLAARQHGLDNEYVDVENTFQEPTTPPPSQVDHNSITSPTTKSVEVPLAHTAEFFEILYDDVAELEKVQAQQQRKLSDSISALSTEIRKLSRPSKTQFHKSDMYRWRELFDIYLQANVFFSTRELDHGARTAPRAAQQLDWFQSEVNRRELIPAFKLKESRVALQKFVDINLEILMNLKFQVLNQQAIAKILKKYDKRTMLDARKTFPSLIKEDAIMTGKIAKEACAEVSEALVKIVPQFEDVSCPICYGIKYRPVRIACGHVLCLDCACEMQHRYRNHCPECRAPVILEADADNLDKELGKIIKKNFPVEWRDAGILQETQDGLKRFGPHYKHPKAGKAYKEPGTGLVNKLWSKVTNEKK